MNDTEITKKESIIKGLAKILSEIIEENNQSNVKGIYNNIKQVKTRKKHFSHQNRLQP